MHRIKFKLIMLMNIFCLCILIQQNVVHAGAPISDEVVRTDTNFSSKMVTEDGDILKLYDLDDKRYVVVEIRKLSKDVSDSRSASGFIGVGEDTVSREQCGVGSSISYSQNGYEGTLYEIDGTYTYSSEQSYNDDGEYIGFTWSRSCSYSGTVYKDESYEILKGDVVGKYKGTHFNVIEKLGTYGQTNKTVNVNDPVNIVTGNFFSSANDLSIDGMLPLSIERNYNSLIDDIGLMGKGWRLFYETSLTVDANGNVLVKYPDGHGVLFTKDGESYVSSASFNERLTKVDNDSFELEFKNKMKYIYSQSGKLVKIIDKNNNYIDVQYNLNGDIAKLLNSNGLFLDFHLTNGVITRIEDDKGRYVKYTYENNNLTTVQTKKGIKRYNYNEHGITSATDYNGNTYITNRYDAFGRINWQVDGSGHIITYEYDEASLQNKHITESTGDYTRYTYDLNMHVTEKVFVDGTKETYTFDDRGNKTSITNRKGYTTQFTYDDRGNMLRITSPGPYYYETVFTYDANDNLTKIQSPDGGEQVFVYNSHANMIEKTIKLDEATYAKTTFTYDEYGRVLTTTNPEGDTTTYTYHPSNPSPISITDADNNQVTYAYDELNRIIAITNANGTTTLAYDQGDNISKITDPLGNTTRMFYDAQGNLVKRIKPKQYNSTTDNGAGYTYTYDEMDKLIKQADPLDNIYAIQYDVIGNKTKDVNPNAYDAHTDDGQGIGYEYDAQNRKVKIINPSGNKSRIKYDALGNITEAIDANHYIESNDNGKGYKYRYDALNRLIEVKDPEGNITKKLVYDKMGRVIKEIGALGYASGTTDEERYGILYKYNLAGWLLEKRIPLEDNGEIRYNIVSYEYDKLGRIITENISNDYVTKTSEPQEVNAISYAYNSKNQVTHITDTLGASIYYAYDPLGNLSRQMTKISDNQTQEIGYTYDKLGRIISRYTKLDNRNLDVDAQDNPNDGYTKATTYYEYDKNGNIIKVTTPEGYVTTFGYDDADRLVTKTQEVTKNTIDQTHVKLELKSPKHKIYENQTYTYSISTATDEQISKINAVIQYDPRIYEVMNLSSNINGLEIVNDKLGKITITGESLDLINDVQLGHIELRTKANVTGIGHVHFLPESTYTDNNGHVKTFTELRGQSQTLNGPDMNNDGHVKADDFALTAMQKGVTEADKYFEFKYDIDGNNVIDTEDLDYISDWLFNDKSASNTPLGILNFNINHTNIRYEKGEEVVSRTTHYKYDKAGHIISETDTNGNTLLYTYDLSGNLIKVKDKEGNITRYKYDHVGNLIKSISPENYNETTDDGAGITYTYNARNQVITITNEEGYVVQHNLYDTKGQLIKRIDGHNYYLASNDTDRNGMLYQYDIGGRITSITSPMSADRGQPTIVYKYDANNNVISHTDGEGHTTHYEKDLWGRTLKKTNAKGITEEYTYDYAGNITSVKDGNGNKTLFNYTNNNLLSQVIDQAGGVVQYKYDREGRLTTEIDRKGQKIKYQYNSDSNLIKRWIEGTTDQEEFLYNSDGSLLAAVNDSSIMSYSYSGNNQITKQSTNGGLTLSYDYNKNGQVKKIINHESDELNYSYDITGRLKSIGDVDEQLVSYAYNKSGTIKNVAYNNGITTSYAYDKNNNIQTLVHQDNQKIINDYRYTYNNNDYVTSEMLNNNKTTYTYDELSQLVSVDYPEVGEESYTYDKAGNRLTKELQGKTSKYTYNGLNQLTNLDENGIMTSYQYDLNGNLIKEVSNENEVNYTYNGFNQLTKVLKQDGNWQQNIYDATGLRNTIIENGIPTKFINSGSKVLAETNNHDKITRINVWGHTLVASKDQVDRNYYYLQNAHTDVIGIVGQDGKIKNSYSYDAFGNITSSKEQIVNRYTYASEQYDRISGHYYLRARYYSPSVGRFIGEDSYRGDGLNLYAYVANNPINYIDPTGYCKEKSSLTPGRQNIDRIFAGATTHMADGGGANNGLKEGANALRNLFNIFSIDAGVVDIDPQTGQVIVNHNFLDGIGLGYKDRDDLTALPSGMVGTKFNLNVNNGMLSYNSMTTNNYISESSRWAINHHYNLAEMKQINIDAKHKLEQLLIDRGAGDYEAKMQKAYNSINPFKNLKDKGAIVDLLLNVYFKASERYQQTNGTGIVPTVVYTIIGGVEGLAEGTGSAFSFALLGEEGVTQAESDLFFYGLLYNVELQEIKKQYSDMRYKSINQEDYYYYNAVIENIDRKVNETASMVRTIFK